VLVSPAAGQEKQACRARRDRRRVRLQLPRRCAVADATDATGETRCVRAQRGMGVSLPLVA
jgi:hypothetical protein